MAVEVEAGSWSPVPDGHRWFHPITASAVTTQQASSIPTLRFTVGAAYTRDMIRGQLWLGGLLGHIPGRAGPVPVPVP